jgi:UDPglucose--hexose-1-phosphate uridylyltransferase
VAPDPAIGRSPHRRLNRLTGEWIVVSPHRTARPWQGQIDDVAAADPPAYDPQCYLCPGNARAEGHKTPHYTSTYVFDNDFPALLPDAQPAREGRGGLLAAESERGLCRVVCFSPRHDLTLGGMTNQALRTVIDTWADQYAELAGIDWVRHVQIFENRGAMMGASNPHPHGQIWATQHLPTEPAKELHQQRAYRGDCLLCDYLAVELAEGERIVDANDEVVALVPYWATWPFETLLLPRSHHGALTDLAGRERDALTDILGRLSRRYDRLFAVSFPYSMGFHQRPTDGDRHDQHHLHAHFYPPLLRSATVRKFMVGFELLGQPQRDTTPESAAQRLRDA